MVSTIGTTLEVAQEIAKCLDVKPEDVHDVASVSPSSVAGYDMVILGASTWGAGDLQEDMATFIGRVAGVGSRKQRSRNIRLR